MDSEALSVASLPPLPLPESITEDYIDCTQSCGLRWHVLRAGDAGRPLVLFCHGYPEIAYSWRRVMPVVAAAGYHCVAMDMRGYGRTTGWPRADYHDVNLEQYKPTVLVRDLVCLVYGLGRTEVHSIIGHDFGAVPSAMAALMRPDIFKSTIQLSHPHHPPPTPALGESSTSQAQPAKPDIRAELAALDPPRKHYKWDNSKPEAADEWDHPGQGLASFLRGYFHLKSADWKENAPRPLERWSGADLAVMPEYYIMRKELSMAQTVARNMEGEDEALTEAWLPPADLSVYCDEWARTGFQGALNWYRASTSASNTPELMRDMFLFAGRRIEVPCTYISGRQDWGNYQQPGAFEAYEDPRCVREGCFRGARLIDRAGHWVQQEQPEAVAREILDFFETL